MLASTRIPSGVGFCVSLLSSLRSRPEVMKTESGKGTPSPSRTGVICAPSGSSTQPLSLAVFFDRTSVTSVAGLPSAIVPDTVTLSGAKNDEAVAE